MREMLVAPVRRGAIVVGKAVGGATTGMFQGLIVLALGFVVGVPFDPLLIVQLVGMLVVLSFAITSIGVLVACRIKSFQALMALVQIIVMPLFFLSGALYPLRGLPTWLEVLTRLDPLTYAVDPMRRAVVGEVAGDAAPHWDVTWSGWVVPSALELGIVALTGLVALSRVRENRMISVRTRRWPTRRIRARPPRGESRTSRPRNPRRCDG
jgi:ABC-2 type transport system permease protein